VPVLGGFLADFRAATRNLEGKIWQGDASVLSFTFLDVGEGDSAVIRFPNKQIWVFDAGGIRFFPSHEDTVAPFDIGEAVVSRYLWDSWIIKLDRLILSHTDLDHAGGMPAVMKNFRIGRFDYSQAGADAILNEILGVSRQRQINAHVVHAGMEEKVGEVTVRTLNPPADFRMASANENSIVLEFSLKHFAALLTGDLEKAGEIQVVSHAGSLRSQLLKVAHHGSRWGTSNALLDRAQPRWAVISVGRNNPFGHPSPEVFMRLLRHGTRPFLTLDEGAVTFETDGVHYAIKSHVRGMVEFGDL